ncbi:MAG: ThuA domain-containing protein [Chloroflexi bacterium]|nr:ThuA domain-containing protein [Chloroflexota bacterium]
MPTPIRAHVIVGGFPPGQHAGHDMDYARLRILQALQANENVHATVSSDYTDCHRWIRDCQLLVTYVAGPFADDHEAGVIRDWIADGGRWLALHGSTGGKAARLDAEGTRQRMVKASYHYALGSFFLTHPPIREFQVDVRDRDHVLTHNLPESFRIKDEPYMIEVLHPETRVLLSTAEVPPPPAETQELYGGDTSLLPDGKSRALGFVREIGAGSIAYVAPGHCHSPLTNMQPSVDVSISPDGAPPLRFRGPWETEPYETLVGNAIAWGTGVEG